jgi:hypothetical protein
MSNNIPSFTLESLLSGQHDNLLRELAAKEMKWVKVPIPEKLQFGAMAGKPNYYFLHELPNYPASLDACRELLAALTDEEWHVFEDCLYDLTQPTCWIKWRYPLLASPLHLLIAFCLTRNLIKLL